eukprot:TRINITY_DN30030_c0_g1_i1.p1 TRINITY_DN30030_c0_g1~~TRINITY_DN30030_c0_g1_i1.p1  ORF type:complete len:316 (-),score=40.66 TRINITY_DN30030_c0_g1_i1:90-1037(-)
MKWYRLISACIVVAIAALITSWEAQSLVVFVWWLNWPRFDWADPAKPSPAWAHTLGKIIGRVKRDAIPFDGFPDATPIVTRGAKGTLRGWRLPRKGSGRCVVLYLHGNAGNIVVEHRVKLYELLREKPLNCDVVAMDYGGFGASDGWWPDEKSAVKDAVAMLRMVASEFKHLIVWGHSLGTGISVGALKKLSLDNVRLPAGVVLEAPFTSVPDVVSSFLGWLPVSLSKRLEHILRTALAAHEMPSIRRISSIADRTRIAILHGKFDEIVPYEHGVMLAEAADIPLHTFESGHSDIVDNPELAPNLQALFHGWGVA